MILGVAAAAILGQACDSDPDTKADATDATTSDATTFDATTSDATTFDATTPDATTPDATTPDATTPDATTADATTPDTTPEDTTTPMDTTPEDTTTPVDTAPEDTTTPVDTAPEDTTTPIDTTPIDTAPEDTTTPVDTAPEDTTTPIDTTPPVDTTPPEDTSTSDAPPDGRYVVESWVCTRTGSETDVQAFALSLGIQSIVQTFAGSEGTLEVIYPAGCVRTVPIAELVYPSPGTITSTVGGARTCTASCSAGKCTAGDEPLLSGTYEFTYDAPSLTFTRSFPAGPASLMSYAGCLEGDTETAVYIKQ